MSAKTVLAIDQSTSGTKALLFDEQGELLGRHDLPHEQKINSLGWVSHDPMEIYRNALEAVKALLEKTSADPASIAALGISNQRETALVWDRDTGLPVADAVVWQCARAQGICDRIQNQGELVRQKTGLNLSPYFPAAKWAWLLENTPDLAGKNLCAGTIDAWLVYKLTGGKVFATDYSNASRSQLFNLTTLEWDEELCQLFGVPVEMLPQVRFSDGDFGQTDLEGLLPHPVPIRGVLGDSHGALFGQGCHEPGMIKATYGTGSSVMMHIGEKPVFSQQGVVTSLAWGMEGKVSYVLEGNINYTGAVTKWVVEDLGLLSSSKEAGPVAQQADPSDTTYLIPAFTGLGAPYWDSGAKGVLCGMSRTTGRAEIVKAAEECIAYQITDVIRAMGQEAGVEIGQLRVDGGPTKDRYLMQFQSDILGIPVAVPEREELSAMGAAFCAGIAAGVYSKEVFQGVRRQNYVPKMEEDTRQAKYAGWKRAVVMLLNRPRS
jgi:glycerol kinase